MQTLNLRRPQGEFSETKLNSNARRKTIIYKALVLLLPLLLPATLPAQLTYTVNNDTVTITGYIGTGPVDIPPTITGLPVTAIGDSAFVGSTITSLAIPSTLTTIGVGVFDECYNLAAINVDPLNAVYSSVAGVLFNKPQTTLWRCPAGQTGSYVVPATVTNLADEAFFECLGVTNIAFPPSVAGIGSYAFSGSGLTSVSLPSLVTSLGSSAFYGCASLTQVTLPPRLGSIGDWAFAGTGLTGQVFPASLTNLADAAFYGCTSLTNLFFKGDVPTLGAYVFYGEDQAKVYYFPGTTGWTATLGANPVLPTILWNALMQSSATNFGVKTNLFGFPITGTADLVVVVEGSASLEHPLWVSLSTNRLAGGSSYFSDAQWLNRTNCFYRLRAQ